MDEREQRILEEHSNYIYNWVSQYDEQFANNTTLQGWEDKIRRDAAYRKELFDWIKRKEQKLLQQAEDEGKQPWEVFEKPTGTFEYFEADFFPVDKKKNLDSDSTSQEDIMESDSATTFWDSSNVDSDYYKPRSEDYVSTFDEQGFNDWWTTNPEVVAWKEDYLNKYGVEPTLDAPLENVPAYYDIRSAYELGITPQIINNEYTWSNTNNSGQVITSANSYTPSTDWRQQFEKDTGTPAPSDMTQAEAYATYYDAKNGRYTLIDREQYQELDDLRFTESKGDYSHLSAEDRAKYGLVNEDDLSRAYYSYFKVDPSTLGLTAQDMIQALNEHEQTEWKNLTNLENMTWLFDQQEEVAAPLLEQMFKEYGFEVGQRKIGKDYIEITAANGESITLSVDRDEGGSWLEGETWVMGNTNSSAQNAQQAINFFNKHRQTRVPGEQKFQDSQDAQFLKDWKKHQREAQDFKKQVSEYDKINEVVSKTPRSKMGSDEYIEMRDKIIPMRNELITEQDRLTQQDAKLLGIQEELNLRPIVSEEWVQGEGAFMDFFNDVYQTFQVGQTKGAMQDDVLNVMWEGANITEGEMKDLLGNWEAIKASGMPDELKLYNKEVAECGGDFACAAKALYKYPSVATMVLAESVGSYLNMTTLEIGAQTLGSVWAASTAGGAVAGGPAGAAGGAALGVPAGLMAAVGVMSGSIEATMTFMELLNEKTGGDMSDEAIRKVLNDPDALSDMRREAIGRGMIIGGFDTLTAGFGGMAIKSLGGKPLLAAAVGMGIESVGGAGGEFAAQVAAGDGISASDVLLEGVAGVAGAPVDVAIALADSRKGGVDDVDSEMQDFFDGDMTGGTSNRLLPGTYKLNGQQVSPEDMVDFVTKGTPKQVASATIGIDGNPKLKRYTQNKRDNAIQRYEVDKNIDPLIKNPEDRNALIDLELERKKLEGNDTYTAKLRLRQIDGDIKSIVDKYTSKPEGKTDIESFFEEDTKKGTRGSRLDPLQRIDSDSPNVLQNDLNRTQDLIKSLEGLNIDFDNPKTDTEKRQAAIYNEAKELETIFKSQIKGAPEPTTKPSRFVAGKSSPVTINPEGPGTLGVLVVPKRKDGGVDVQMKSTKVVKGRSLGRNIYLIDESLQPGERTSFSNPDPIARQRTIKAAEKAFRSIKKIAPNVNLLMYETHKEYMAAGNSRDSSGNFSPLTNNISISLEKTNPSVVPHEVMHGVLKNLFPDLAGKELKTKELAEAIIRIVKKRNVKLASDLKKANPQEAGNIQTELNENDSFIKELQGHVDKYEGVKQSVKNEEFVVEAIALIATRYPKLPKEAKSKVRQFIEWVLNKLGLGKYIDRIYKKAPDDVIVDALNSMADKMRTGETITTEDVSEAMSLSPEQEAKRKEARAGEKVDRERYRNKIEEMKEKAGGVENMTADELVILESLELELAALERGQRIPGKELVVEGVETDVEESVKDLLGVDEVVRKKTTKTPTYKEPDSVIEDTPTEVEDTQDTFYNEEEDINVVDGVQIGFFHNTKDAAGVNIKPIEKGKGEATQLYKGAYHPKPGNLTFFTPSRKKFSDLGRGKGASKKYKVKLNIKNPYFVKKNKVWSDAEVFELKEKGYDTIITHVDNLTDIYTNRENEMNIIPIDKSIIEVVGEVNPRESRFEISERKMDKESKAESPEERNSEIIDIVQKARENNFSDLEITDYLVRIKKFKPAEVKKALEISIDETTLLPKSFAELKGGIESGVRLFKRVNKYKDSLVARNKQAKKKLNQEQITDKVIQYLEQQPEFTREGSKKELSPLQAKMQVELQSTLGMRPTRDMAKVLRESKRFIKGVEKGEKSLQAFKQDLRNFMRKALPATTYTKPEVLKMVGKIEAANRSSIKNIMNEVIDFTNEKVATSLEKDINTKLNAKNEVKLSGRNKATKIDADAIEQIKMIKKERVSQIATPKEIYETNARLADEYNELSKEINPTDAQIKRMGVLETVMKLNNASLMENSDINKVQELSDVNNSLEEIIVGGRQRLEEEIQAAREEYERQLSIAWEAITKEKVDASTQEGKNQIQKTTNYLVTKEEVKATQNVLRKILRGVGNNLSDIFVSHEALDGLMDKITLMPGELFGGALKDLVYERVNEGTRLYKGRKMAVEKLIIDKVKELYGKKWRTKMVSNRKVGYNKIYKDGDAVLAAQKKYNADKTSANKEALKRAELENNIQGVTYASQEQLYYLYNQFKDPALHPTFEKMWGKDYKKVAEQIEKALNPEVKKFADWQVDELFPALYPHYNKTYRKIYRTNMPQNEHYAGTLYREGVKSEPVDLLSGDNQFYTSIGESSTIARVKNTNPIQSMIGTDALMTYVTDMEYFAAMAEPLRDIDKLFTNENVKKAIISIHGKNTYGLIKSAIQKLANRGVRSHDMNKFINGMNNVFIYSRLGFNPTITIKQLTSMFTYANDIGFRNWVKYGFKNMPELKKLWKEVQSNSVYLQDRRYNGIMRNIESYTETQMQSLVPKRNKQFMVNFLMWFTKFGDMGAIMLGGLPNYSYYKAQYKKKNPRATEQQAIDYAIRKFESDTKRTQQSVDLQDKDVYQTSNPLVRAMNMFLTSPKAYLRKEIQANRNLWRIAKARDFKAGKGTPKEAIRTFIMYHVFLPVLFQFVAMGFKIDEEDDWWDLARAAVIGNLNSLFIIGDLFNYLGDLATGKPWAGDNDGALRILTIASKITKDWSNYLNAKKQETKDKYLKEIILETLTLTGLPSHQIDRFIENYGKVMTGDVDNMHELILRLLNYSQYQIEGGGKGKKSKKKKYPRSSGGSSSKGGEFDIDFGFDEKFNFDEQFDFDFDKQFEDLIIEFDF